LNSAVAINGKPNATGISDTQRTVYFLVRVNVRWGEGNHCIINRSKENVAPLPFRDTTSRCASWHPVIANNDSRILFGIEYPLVSTISRMLKEARTEITSLPWQKTTSVIERNWQYGVVSGAHPLLPLWPRGEFDPKLGS
jgi:hypothetical protein